jgi:hypothetical protein
MTSLTAVQLRKAASIREKIDRLQTELDLILGGSSAPKATAAPTVRRRRKMSAAARARIGAAAKARWAKMRAAKKS